MDFIEVIGGIKAEIKSENNVVEIRAEDIQNETEKEAEENVVLEKLEHTVNNNIENLRDVNVQRKNRQNEKAKVDTKNQSIGQIKIDFVKKEIVPEKIILNYTNEDTADEKAVIEDPFDISHQDIPIPKKMKKPKNPKKKKSKNDVKKKTPFRHKEYSVVDNKRYRCNHCKGLFTHRRAIVKHIYQNHRDAVFYTRVKKEQLERMLQASDVTKYVAWYEYAPDNAGRYRCNHCKTLINGQQQTEKHIIENHRTVILKQCPHCPYRSRYYLSKHIISCHTDEKDIEYYRCDQCECKFKLKSGLQRHMYWKHTGPSERPELIGKCPQCSRIFKRTDSLSKHILHVHNADLVEKVKCFHCAYESISKESLKHHIDSLHSRFENLETLKCKLCAYKTKFKQRLQTHVSIRHTKQLLQCHICSYRSTSKHTMDLHFVGHKKEKDEKDWRYRCDQCDYKTYRTYSLQIHKLNHLKPEEIQYFYCYHCAFKAKRKDNLKSHIYRHYKKDELSFECYICKFTTKKRDQLFRHIDKHSKESKKPKIEVVPSRELRIIITK